MQRFLFMLGCLLLTAVAPALATADRAGNAPRQAAKPAAVEVVRTQPLLLPEATLPRFAQIAPVADEVEALSVAVPAVPLASARFQFDTGLCVAFLGAAQETGPAPDRDSVHGNPTDPEEPILCQLAAGVSYPLAPGANLNLGYQLPNRVWGGMGRNLGLDDKGLDASAQGVSVGVQVTF